MNNSIEFSFKINDEEMEKLKKILTSGGVRHYLIKTTNGEELDVVEYKEYQKLEKENQELKEQQKEFMEWLENESKEIIRDASYHQRICLDILSKYKEIIGSDK